VAIYRKRELPNYTVFDEDRYFEPGTDPCVIDIAGVRVGIVICEDIWFPAPAGTASAAGAQIIVVPNGSPYHTRQQAFATRRRDGACAGDGSARRLRQPRRRPGRAGIRRRVVHRRRSGRAGAAGAGVARDHRASEFVGAAPKPVRGALDGGWKQTSTPHCAWACTTTSKKNHFPGVLLGLSGGIDSALTLAIAVDALGRDRVRVVMLPSPYNAAISLDDARAMAGILGVRYDEIPIDVHSRRFGQRSPRSSRVCPKTRPRRTSRRGFAARC